LRRAAASLWLAAGTFVIYAAGACPTIYVGDSGELVTAASVLGIPHPSGYPLYVLLGKLWTVLVPIGSIAYRMSLLSAACAAGAVGLLHGLSRRLGLHPAACVLAALLFAFSPSFWGEANVQRVYALNALFVAAATAAAFSWHRSRAERALLLAFLLCGSGAANHTFMAVYALALAALVLAVEPALARRPRQAALCLSAFVVGLLPYLYLPLRSRADPVLDWGNPDTPRRFLDVVLRRGFWGRAWVETPLDAVAVVLDYLRGLGAELLWVGAALALVGLYAGRRRRLPVLLPVLVMAANLGAVALHGSRTDIFVWHRYYIPSYMMASLLAGMGGHWLIERLPRALRLLPLLLPALALFAGWGRFDRSRYRIAEDFSRKLLGGLPPGASLAASDDNILFVLIYLHWVEGQRPDIDLILEGVGGADLPRRRFNPDSDPLFLTHHPNWSLRELDVVPVGLVFQTVRAGRPWPAPTLPETGPDGEHDPSIPKDFLTRNLIGHFHYMLGVTFEERDWRRAAGELRAATTAAPDNDVLFYNLGLIYWRNGLLIEALAAFRRADAINPRTIATAGRVRAGDRIAELLPEVERLRRIEQHLAAELQAERVGPGGARFHEAMAERLDLRGEGLAARGHRLRALGETVSATP
jgi:tetratricopeptide (TPR) repeat protein